MTFELNKVVNTKRTHTLVDELFAFLAGTVVEFREDIFQVFNFKIKGPKAFAGVTDVDLHH
uniref:hypothetical protein n=1 Tax=Flavobacterium sp. TaxID=239 RepID=UPI004048CEBA